MRRFACANLIATLLLATRLFAAAPVYTTKFASVTLDGVRIGTDLDPSNSSMFPTVVYDPQFGVFHMWVAASSALTIEGLRHATSSDGVHFISTGNLSFAGGSPFPAYGAPTEPQFEFPRAARIGADWKLLIWTENNSSGAYGDYNYNESVNDIGADPGPLAVAHQGPIYPTNGAGTFGQTTGPFGIVNGKLYVADDRPGGVSKWNYNDTTPPSVDTPADHSQDLITGTGYVYFLTHPGDPLGVYVHNIGRVLDQGDGTLGVYYSLRHPDGSRVNKQIYYAESGDDGQSWSAPVGIFSNGDAVRVDGAPNQFDFSHPEVTLVGARRVLYFSTKSADGAFVVATSAAQPPSAGSWADILGSGQGAGESGVGVVRTADGGYAIATRTLGLTPTAAFWLVKLDGTGDVVWQKLYTGAGAGSSFFPTALAEAPDGGFVMAGYFADATSAMWILKVDLTGAVVWSNSYSTCDGGNCGNRIRALVRTADGGFAFASNVGGYFGVGKIDGAGSLLWIKSYPSDSTDPTNAVALVEAPDGGLAVAGTWSKAGVCRVLRTDAAGAIVWEQKIGTDQRPPAGIVNRNGGGFALTGTVAGAPWVITLDDAGAVSWDNTVSCLGGAGIVPSASGGYAVASIFEQAALFELDAEGAPVWAKAFGALPSSLATFHALVSTLDGGYLAVGDDVVGTDSRLLAVKVDAGGGFVGCLDEEFSFPLTAMPTSLTSAPLTDSPVDETPNTTVAAQTVTAANTDASERIICRATLPTELGAAALSVDPTGNGVAEPGEQFATEPSWSNFGLLATFLSGHTSALSDSNGLDTAAPDPDAAYGTVASLATSDCATATGDCFQFQFHDVLRPSQHWDTYADETLTTSDPHHRFAKRWTIHVGLSFDDVSSTSGFYPFVENLFHNGITAGCGGIDYCPGSSTTRAQMSVFLLKSRHGASFVPPNCSGAFADVPCPSLFANWIEELAAEGVTVGCGGGNYCPDAAVTRQQMSAFLLKALSGSGYVPPTCAGIFSDVACPSLFADWIEDLYNRQITAGCSASPLLYCPADPNTRQQMAVFLVKTFSLVLYGP